jgi:TRAP transporter TAXI family solute receptor
MKQNRTAAISCLPVLARLWEILPLAFRKSEHRLWAVLVVWQLKGGQMIKPGGAQFPSSNVLYLVVGALLSACAATIVAPENYKMATGAPGGGFHPYGEAVAKAINESGQLKLSTEHTPGSSVNLKSVNEGKVAFALTVMGPAFEAWNGLEAWTGGQKMRGFRALAPMYETPFHTIVLASSPIRSMRDLNGRRIGVGPEKGTGDLLFAGLAAALGIRAEQVYGSPTLLAEQLSGGKIEAFFYGAGLPVPAFKQAADRSDIRVIGFSETELNDARKRFPYLSRSSIPLGTYRGQGAPVDGAAVWNFVVAHESVPDAAAYAFVSALFDSASRIAGDYPAAAATKASNAPANTFLPFHPGVVQAYRERGVTLPPLR